MRYSLILLITTFFSFHSYSQEYSNIPSNYILEVIPDSSMFIEGKTNINSFDCMYKNNLKSTLILSQDIFKELTDVQHTGLAFGVSCFDCGIALMNKEFSDLLYAEQFPTIIMKLLTMYVYQDTDGLIKGKGKVSMIIAGTERVEEIEYKVPHIEGRNFQIIGKKKINIIDYGLTPPKKMMGMVKVDQYIDVNFNFKFIVDDH